MNTNNLFNGIAYKTNDDSYVCYDVATEELIDVNQIMVVPLAKKDLKVGDIIQHNEQLVIIKEIRDYSNHS